MKKNLLNFAYSLSLIFLFSLSLSAQFDDLYYSAGDADYSFVANNVEHDHAHSYGEVPDRIARNDYNDGFEYTRRINSFYRPGFFSVYNAGLGWNAWDYNPAWRFNAPVGFFYDPYGLALLNNRPWGWRNFNRFGRAGNVFNGIGVGGFGVGGFGAAGCPPGFYGNTRTVRNGEGTRLTGRSTVASPRRGTVSTQSNPRLRLRSNGENSNDKRAYGTNTTTKRHKKRSSANSTRNNRKEYRNNNATERRPRAESRRSNRSNRSFGNSGSSSRRSGSLSTPRSSRRSSFSAPRSSSRFSSGSSRGSFRSSARGMSRRGGRR